MTFIEALSYYPSATICGAIILGLMVGSFLNVVIYRLPVMMEREWKHECKILLESANEPDQLNHIADSKSHCPHCNTIIKPWRNFPIIGYLLFKGQCSQCNTKIEPEPFNIAFPNSRCPHCNTTIKPWQNIPVISYLLLKGQCSQCHAKISLRYPIIEMATGIMSGIIAWQLGATPQTIFALILTWSLISLTMIDADHQLLPDQITLPLLWLGLLVNSFGMFNSLHSAVWGAIGGYMSLWIVYWSFKILTGKEGMGYGDFKLLAVLGAWMGWQVLPIIILLSSLVGAIVGSILLIINKKGRNTTIPFGPYLAVAGWIAFLWSEPITQTYFHISGIK